MPREPKLDDLRQEIDAIDDQIHELIMRRTEIVAEIGGRKRAAKIAGPAFRPGREAAMIRRLMNRHQGNFPARVLVRIWRELVSAQVGLQGPFSVAVYSPDNDMTFRETARAHFGSHTAITGFGSVNQVLQAVTNGEAAVGALPMPIGECDEPWWRHLASSALDVPRVIARLPFLADETDDSADTLVIARLQPETTGDDISLIVIESDEGMSRDRMRAALQDNDLTVSWLNVCPDPQQPGHSLHLVSVDESIDRDEPRLQSFQDAASPDVSLAIAIGSFARQWAGPDDAKPA